MGALPALLKGAAVLLAEKFDAGDTLRAIERHGVTWVSGVPTTFQLMLEHPDWATTDLSTVTKLTCGGSAIPMPVLEAYELRGLAFTGGYGLTEASPGVTSLRPAHSREKAGSAGQPHSFTEVRIVDGEIQVRGPNVMLGYWNNPEATAEAFSPDGWLRTGDLGRWDDDGFLSIAGRAKELIISGGENIYPAEVELLIAELDGVTGVVVVGVADAKWGEVPVAVVTGSVDETAAIAHLSAHLARYKVPKRFVVVESLPRTSTGKVIRREVEAMLQ
jgi:fatty-acyl-CoA synthase